MISLCNYCDRHTPADGSKWIPNDLNKVRVPENIRQGDDRMEAIGPFGPSLPPTEPAMPLPRHERRRNQARLHRSGAGPQCIVSAIIVTHCYPAPVPARTVHRAFVHPRSAQRAERAPDLGRIVAIRSPASDWINRPLPQAHDVLVAFPSTMLRCGL